VKAMLKKSLLLGIVLTFCTGFLFAQSIEAITQNGKIVLLNGNGTWEYLTDTTETIKENVIELNCKYKRNEVDDFTGDRVVEMEHDALFQVTDNDSKVGCTIACMSVENTFVAKINLAINSKSASSSHGYISSGSKMIFKTANNTVELEFLNTDFGKTMLGQIEWYQLKIFIDPISLKILEKDEVEKVRIYWSKGYEDYIVTNQSLFIDQLNCKNRARNKLGS